MAKKEKKVFFESSDGLEDVLKSLKKSSVEKVIFVIPKRSPLGESVENFHVLREKAKFLKKEIVIESVDDHILECAALAQIPAVNPVFRIRERAISDIIVRPKTHQTRIEAKINESEEAVRKEKIIISKAGKTKKVEQEEELEQKFPEDEKKEEKTKKVLFALRSQKKEERTIHERFEKKQEREKKKGKAKKIIIPAFIVIILATGWFVWTYILPHADITLITKRTKRDIQESVLISVKETSWSISPDGTLVLPGQMLTASKNAQVEIPAAGKAQANEKAKGRLTIYNGYDEKPQMLVASTRFESPDGKIFRLVSQIIVPGGKKENGVVTPGSIVADVVADQPGDAYNLSPVKNWKVPGFKGTPRYASFYAENTEAMTGGFSGERPSATENDMKLGEEKLIKTLTSALDAQMSILLTQEFKLIDGATSFSLLKKELQSDASRPNSALLYGEAEMKKIVFIEEMIGSAVMEKYSKDLPENIKPEELHLSYGSVQANFADGTMRVPVSGSVIFASEADPQEVLNNILGKDEKSIQEYTSQAPWFDTIKISFWPVWVDTIPKNKDRVNLEIK